MCLFIFYKAVAVYSICVTMSNHSSAFCAELKKHVISSSCEFFHIVSQYLKICITYELRKINYTTTSRIIGQKSPQTLLLLCVKRAPGFSAASTRLTNPCETAFFICFVALPLTNK